MVLGAKPIRVRAALGLITALVVGAGACGGSAPAVGGDAVGTSAAAVGIERRVESRASTIDVALTPIVSTPTPTPAPTTPAPTTSVVPTITIPIDPDETLVATARPELTELTAYAAPDGEPVTFEYAITNPTYFDHDLVLMVTDVSGDDRWVKVQVPVRPNGTEVWIRVADVTLSTHRYRARVDLTERSVTVWNGDDVVAQTDAVIGAEQTPTPLGRFYVNDLVEKWDTSAFGPYILSLSGFSEALDTFAGGVPVIAIHGTNRPDLLGGAYSNGCIRIPNEIVTVLAETVPMGTPVDIVA